MQSSCPHCQCLIELPDSLAGQAVSCPQCKGVFAAPAAPPIIDAPGGESVAVAMRRRTSGVGGGIEGLFDLGFRSFVSPTLIAILYLLGMVVLAIWLVVTVGRTGYSIIYYNPPASVIRDMMIGIGINIVGTCIALLTLRVSCESALILFRIEEHLRKRSN